MSLLLSTTQTDTLKENLIQIRRDFHMHPELSGEEKRTSGIVADFLTNLGLEVETGVGGYGVVGILRGEKPGKVAAWRADMDAFPSENTLDVPYKSQVPGVKHVCGHDVHTTIALGIAQVLAGQRENINGTIKFIFQPAEETGVGALGMVKDGALQNPQPDAIFGLHAAPFPVGTVASVAGLMLPEMRLFTIQFDTESAHQEECKALFQEIIQVLRPLNTLTMDLNVIFDPEVDLSTFVVLGAIPDIEEDSGKLKGMNIIVRTSDEGTLEAARTNMESRLDALLAQSPVKFTYNWPEGQRVPPTINDEHLEKEMRSALTEALGEENLVLLNKPVPFNSEDFSQYLLHVPGVFYWLGVANPDKGIPGVPHTPEFDIDEDSIMVGVDAMSALLLSFLAK